MKTLKYQFDKDIAVNTIASYDCFSIDLAPMVADGKTFIVIIDATLYDASTSQASTYGLKVFTRDDSNTIQTINIAIDGNNRYTSNTDVQFLLPNLTFIRSAGTVWTLTQKLNNGIASSRNIRYVADVTIIIGE